LRQQEAQVAALRQQRLLTLAIASILAITLAFVVALLRSHRKLQGALREVRTLSGFIPICAHCKSVRDDAGYWRSVDEYLATHSPAQVSHSICNRCGPKLYGEDWSPQRS